jgi:phosphoribosylpyrophosphate synthetase
MNNFEKIQDRTEERQAKKYDIRDDKSIDADIRDLYLPTKELFKDIKERVINKEYFLVIGDDVSGRIPALVFDELIRNEYKKQNREKEHPKLIFIAGSRDYSYGDRMYEEKERKVFDLIKKESEQNKFEGKRVLIVTDTIETGRSLLPLVHSLKKLNIDYDIVSASGGLNYREHSARKELGENVFAYKIAGGMTGPTYNRKDLAGVTKKVFDLHGKSLREDSELSETRVNERVAKARKDAHKVSRYLIEEMENEK